MNNESIRLRCLEIAVNSPNRFISLDRTMAMDTASIFYDFVKNGLEEKVLKNEEDSFQQSSPLSIFGSDGFTYEIPANTLIKKYKIDSGMNLDFKKKWVDRINHQET